MHRTAASLVGLALIVSSIWYNATHFPIRWDASPSVSSERQDSRRNEMRPESNGTLICENFPKNKVSGPSDEEHAQLSEKTDSPALPIEEGIPPLMSIASQANRLPREPAVGIIRLPPVERNWVVQTSSPETGAYGHSIRVYPSTGVP